MKSLDVDYSALRSYIGLEAFSQLALNKLQSNPKEISGWRLLTAKRRTRVSPITNKAIPRRQPQYLRKVADRKVAITVETTWHDKWGKPGTQEKALMQFFLWGQLFGERDHQLNLIGCILPCQ